MNIQSIHKAAKIADEIKAIDADIAELNRFAYMIANDGVKCRFKFSLEDVAKKKASGDRIIIDDMGDMKKAGPDSHPFDPMEHLRGLSIYHQFLPGISCNSQPAKSEHDHVLKNTLTDNTALQIVGILMSEKYTARERLFRSLNKLGVSK